MGAPRNRGRRIVLCCRIGSDGSQFGWGISDPGFLIVEGRGSENRRIELPKYSASSSLDSHTLSLCVFDFVYLTNEQWSDGGNGFSYGV